MDSKRFFKLAGIFLPAFIFLFLGNIYCDIIEEVKNLNICVGNFCIGQKFKGKNLEKIQKSYKGTEKYKFKDLIITISQKKKIIIGLYKKYDNATFKQFKKTISFLMMKFGEPTIEAHGKNIYWFYSKNGKITHEKFIEMKKKNKIEKPLLMVKFHSETFLSKAKNKNKKINFYFIIYSEPLIKHIIEN